MPSRWPSERSAKRSQLHILVYAFAGGAEWEAEGFWFLLGCECECVNYALLARVARNEAILAHLLHVQASSDMRDCRECSYGELDPLFEKGVRLAIQRSQRRS
jgi:hypothetical protein